jgi:hypothetical protein
MSFFPKRQFDRGSCGVCASYDSENSSFMTKRKEAFGTIPDFPFE